MPKHRTARRTPCPPSRAPASRQIRALRARARISPLQRWLVCRNRPPFEHTKTSAALWSSPMPRLRPQNDIPRKRPDGAPPPQPPTVNKPRWEYKHPPPSRPFPATHLCRHERLAAARQAHEHCGPVRERGAEQHTVGDPARPSTHPAHAWADCRWAALSGRGRGRRSSGSMPRRHVPPAWRQL